MKNAAVKTLNGSKQNQMKDRCDMRSARASPTS
jgi:hypothetical protein